MNNKKLFYFDKGLKDDRVDKGKVKNTLRICRKLKYKYRTDPTLGMIERKFKCCRKYFKSYVCVNCYGIFHSSYPNKTRTLTELEGYKCTV